MVYVVNSKEIDSMSYSLFDEVNFFPNPVGPHLMKAFSWINLESGSVIYRGNETRKGPNKGCVLWGLLTMKAYATGSVVIALCLLSLLSLYCNMQTALALPYRLLEERKIRMRNIKSAACCFCNFTPWDLIREYNKSFPQHMFGCFIPNFSLYLYGFVNVEDIHLIHEIFNLKCEYQHFSKCQNTW